MKVESTIVRAADAVDAFTGVVTDEFSASDTWTKRPGVVAVLVTCIGGGAGGGSGRVGAAAGTRSGGTGGGSGGWTEMLIPASLLGSTETVTVGAAGTGASAQTADNSDGTAGTAGGGSSFGSWVIGGGGGAGQGGIASTAVLGGTAGLGSFPGVNASNSNDSGSPATMVKPPHYTPGSGGTGGSIHVTDTVRSPNAGNDTGTATAGGINGAAGVTSVGGNGTGSTMPNKVGGGGGGGGSGSKTTNAYAGGNGAAPGGGGGGGGAALNSWDSGAGGNGAIGRVIVVSYFG